MIRAITPSGQDSEMLFYKHHPALDESLSDLEEAVIM
jgi:hypothetical protein